MNETELQDALATILESLAEARDEAADTNADEPLADIAREMAEELGGVEDVATFERVGLLTRNAGLVLRLADGSEFQLTIVQSRIGERAAGDDAE